MTRAAGPTTTADQMDVKPEDLGVPLPRPHSVHLYSHYSQNGFVTRAIVVARWECSGHLATPLILRVWLHRWEIVLTQLDTGNLINNI